MIEFNKIDDSQIVVLKDGQEYGALIWDIHDRLYAFYKFIEKGETPDATIFMFGSWCWSGVDYEDNLEDSEQELKEEIED